MNSSHIGIFVCLFIPLSSPPLPPLGAGLHRYVFLVLEQTIPILFSSSPTPPKTESLTDGRTDEYSRSKSPVPGYQKEKVELKSGRQMESNKAESKNQRYDDRGPKSMLNDDRATNKAMNKSAQNSARNDDFSSPKIKGNGETDQLSPYSDNKFRLSPTPPPQYSRRESMPNIERKKFSTKDFIKKHTIQSIVAGNFFQVGGLLSPKYDFRRNSTSSCAKSLAHRSRKKIAGRTKARRNPTLEHRVSYRKKWPRSRRR